MDRRLFLLVLLGFALSATAQVFPPLRYGLKKFYPLNGTCPRRPPKSVAIVMDCSADTWAGRDFDNFWFNGVAPVLDNLYKEKLMNSAGITSELRDDPILNNLIVCAGAGSVSYHVPEMDYPTHSYSVIPGSGLVDWGRALRVLLTYVEMFSGESAAVIFRWNREGAEVPEYDTLKGLGARVITVDFGGQRQDALATGSASAPQSQNAFVYPEWTNMDPWAITQAVRRDAGRVCVVSGRTHITTFDGVAYRHDDIGDYVLYRQFPFTTATHMGSSVEIQIRKSQCEYSLKRMACITGVAVRVQWTNDVPEELAMQYDPTHNDLAITLNAKLIPLETVGQYILNGEFTRLEGPNKENVGVRVTLNHPWTQMSGGEPAMMPALVVEWYAESGRDPVIIINPGFTGWTMSTGMCGTFDSCDLNDFVTPGGTFTAENASFTTEWRVQGAASIFEWVQYGPTDDPEALTLRQPLYTPGWTSQAKKKDAGEDPLSKEALYFLCADACEQGTSGSAWLNAQGIDAMCGDLCDTVSASLEGLKGFDLHADWSQTVPAVYVAEMNGGRKASVRIPIEGTYTFQVHSSDCCSNSESANVTVGVRCERDFTVDAGEDQTVLLKPYPHAIVRLGGSISSDSDDIHVSWRVVKWPKMLTPGMRPDEAKPAPVLQYRFSLSPSFQPLLAGEYELELVAFDGCHLASDRVVMNLECVERNLTFASKDEQVFWLHDVFSQVSVEYYEACPTSGIPVTPSVVANFTIATAAHPLFEIAEIVPGEEWEVSVKRHVEPEPVVVLGSYRMSDGESNEPWEALPTRDGIVRMEGQRQRWTRRANTTVNTVENVTFVGDLKISQCLISVGSNGGGDSVTQFVQVHRADWPYYIPELPDWANGTDLQEVRAMTPFKFGLCEGQYHVKENLTLDTCSRTQSDQWDLDVTCGADWKGPLAKLLSPCFDVKYDYTNHQFPLVTFNDDSSDRLSRIPSSPADWREWKEWTVLRSPNVSYTFAAGPPATLRSTGEGKYEVQLAVTNGCGVDRDTVEATFMCTGNLVQNRSCPPASAYVFDYNATFAPLRFTSYPLTTALKLDGTRADAWVTTWIQEDDKTGELQTTTSTSSAHTVDFTYVKSHPEFTVKSVTTDGCKTEMSQACSGKLVCPNTVTVVPGIINKTKIFTSPGYTSGGPTYSTTVFLNETSTCEPHPCTTSRVWNFFYNQTFITDLAAASPTGSVTLSVPPKNDNLYSVELNLDDTCQKYIGKETFNILCPAHVYRPYITVDKTVVQLDNGTATVVADLSASTITWATEGPRASSLRFLWQLTSPSGVVLEWSYFASSVGGAPQTRSLQTSEYGTYVLNLTIEDGCNSFSETVSIVTTCVGTFTPAAAAPAPSKWSRNKFDIVTLDGSASTWTFARPTYYWYVVEAPFNSVFEGRNNIRAEVYEDDIELNNTIDPVNGYFWTSLYRNHTVGHITATDSTWYETRLIATAEAAATFGACFRPDLPGNYLLELYMENSCGAKTSSVVTVRATCNAEPTGEPKWPAAASVWERVELDASAIKASAADDVLSYEWSVHDCTDETVVLNDLLLNRHAAKAYFVAVENGTYCLSLVVSDGCNTQKPKTHTLTVSCAASNATDPELKNQEIKVKFDGLDLQKVNMEIPIDENVDATWYDTHYYTWTLVGFDAEPPSSRKLSDGDIAGIVVGSLVGAALIAGVVAAVVLLILKRPGAEKSEISMPSKEGAPTAI